MVTLQCHGVSFGEHAPVHVLPVDIDEAQQASVAVGVICGVFNEDEVVTVKKVDESIARLVPEALVSLRGVDPEQTNLFGLPTDLDLYRVAIERINKPDRRPLRPVLRPPRIDARDSDKRNNERNRGQPKEHRDNGRPPTRRALHNCPILGTQYSLLRTVPADLSLHNGHPYTPVSGPVSGCVFPCKDVVDIDGSGQRSGTIGVEVTLRSGHSGVRLGDARMRRPKESNRGRITTDESISIRQKDVR